MLKVTKALLFAALGSALLSSCVSMREYEGLQSQYSQLMKERNVARQEAQELREENAGLVQQNSNMAMAMADMERAKQECEQTVASINRSYAALQLRYDTTMENYMQQLTGKNRDLSKVSKMLEQRTKELNEKERQYQEKEQQMLAERRELEAEQSQMAREELAATEALEAKERELAALRQAVQTALVGFADKELNVETKDGKVYVSMADNLLFASGSWEVSKKGEEALKKLAKVLEERQSLYVMVEGHTDNDAYKGTSAIKDNWDLSVMRATAVVKLLLKQGPKILPSHITAAGHGEYDPKVKNNNAANKAANRRTEIILTPKFSDILNIIKN